MGNPTERLELSGDSNNPLLLTVDTSTAELLRRIKELRERGSSRSERRKAERTRILEWRFRTESAGACRARGTNRPTSIPKQRSVCGSAILKICSGPWHHQSFRSTDRVQRLELDWSPSGRRKGAFGGRGRQWSVRLSPQDPRSPTPVARCPETHRRGDTRNRSQLKAGGYFSKVTSTSASTARARAILLMVSKVTD